MSKWSPEECDDDNARTDEYCDLSSGNCVFEYNESPAAMAMLPSCICANGSRWELSR